MGANFSIELEFDWMFVEFLGGNGSGSGLKDNFEIGYGFENQEYLNLTQSN